MTQAFQAPQVTSVTTTVGCDPASGHHEISEPNLTLTTPCHRCTRPYYLISVTGLGLPATSAAADQAAGSSVLPLSQVTFTAGGSRVVISKETGTTNLAFAIGGSTTVTPGQTVTINNTPVAVQTSNGDTKVIVGTQTVPFAADTPESAGSQVTEGPITTTLQPVLTFNGETYTANRAGYYILGPGTTLVPGGPAVTISDTTISIDANETAAVIQGSTSLMTPATTIITLPTPPIVGISNWTTGRSTGAGASTRYSSVGMSGRTAGPVFVGSLFEGVLLLGVIGFGWITVWL